MTFCSIPCYANLMTPGCGEEKRSIFARHSTWGQTKRMGSPVTRRRGRDGGSGRGSLLRPRGSASRVARPEEEDLSAGTALRIGEAAPGSLRQPPRRSSNPPSPPSPLCLSLGPASPTSGHAPAAALPLPATEATAGSNFSSKEQASFNFMAAVTICSDFGAPPNKAYHCFHCLPIYLP